MTNNYFNWRKFSYLVLAKFASVTAEPEVLVSIPGSCKVDFSVWNFSIAYEASCLKAPIKRCDGYIRRTISMKSGRRIVASRLYVGA